MGKRDIGKYFKDELSGYSKDVDTNAIWEALNLEKKRKKSPFFLWSTGLTILAVLASIYFVFNENIFQPKNEQLIDNATIEQNESIQSPLDLASSISYSSNSNSGNSVALNTIEEIHLHNKVANKVTGKSDSITQSELTKTRLDINSSDPLKSLETDVNYISEMDQIVAIGAKDNNDFESVDLGHELIDITMISQKGSNYTLLPNTTSKLILPNALEINYAQLFTIEERTLPKQFITERDLLKNKMAPALSLIIYSGASYVDRSLTTQNESLKQFISRKAESETPLELISFGVQLRYNIGSIYFKGGLELQSLNTRFEYEQYSIIDTVPTSGVVGILIDSNGNSFNQVGTVYEENSLTANWTYYNNHLLLNIPLSFGYKKRMNRWSFSIEAQSRLNFLHGFSGKRLDQQGNVTDNNNDINKSFKLGLGVAIGLEYEFSNTTSIYLSPNYFSYLDSFAQSNSYSEKYSLKGLQIGLCYKLF